MKEMNDVERAEEQLMQLQQQIDEIDRDFQAEVDALTAKYDALNEKLDTKEIGLTKSNILVKLVRFVWVPFWETAGETLQQAF